MKKKELPELRLQKRTIASLNKKEMTYVNGGGGDNDDGNLSRRTCEDPGDPDADVIYYIKKLTANITMFCI